PDGVVTTPVRAGSAVHPTGSLNPAFAVCAYIKRPTAIAAHPSTSICLPFLPDEPIRRIRDKTQLLTSLVHHHTSCPRNSIYGPGCRAFYGGIVCCEICRPILDAQAEPSGLHRGRQIDRRGSGRRHRNDGRQQICCRN